MGSDAKTKIGFETIVRHVPQDVIPREHFDYLAPALAKPPDLLCEQFSIVVETGTLRSLRGKYGNMAVADPLVDLAEFGGQGRIAKDSVVALWTVCPGVQSATLVLRWLA